jgi:uncharacterized lipoprotein NlpE involved in copper resistance
MKKAVCSLLLLILVFACNNGAKEPNTQVATNDSVASSGTAKADSISSPADNSQNALDWAGVYKGELPCADCEGIETVVTLNKDFTYTKTTVYLGKKDKQQYKNSGKFTWNNAGSTVTLLGVQDAPNQYMVGEQVLIQLDVAGERITSALAEKYKLTKQ